MDLTFSHRLLPQSTHLSAKSNMAFTQASFTLVAKGSLATVHASALYGTKSVVDGTESVVDTESHLKAQDEVDYESGIEEYFSPVEETASELAALADLAKSESSKSDSVSTVPSAVPAPKKTCGAGKCPRKCPRKESVQSESDLDSSANESVSDSDYKPSDADEASDSSKASTKSTKAAISIIEILSSEDETPPAVKKRKIMANLKKIKALFKEIEELEGGSESD